MLVLVHDFYALKIFLSKNNLKNLQLKLKKNINYLICIKNVKKWNKSILFIIQTKII